MHSLDCNTYMGISKKVILSELRDILLLIIMGIIMTWSGLGCRNCEANTPLFWIVASFTSLSWVLLWKGNSYLADFISTKMSWVQYPLKRFVVSIISTMAYTVLAAYGTGALYEMIFDLNLNYSMMYSVLITIVISLFMHGRSFLFNWKQTTVDAERLQKENIAAKYESLKNQVNPHFLFNSLNALSNLVYEDQDKAVKFIKQLSEVYRYVLDTRDKEVVPVAEEIRFLQSYLYLQKIRFGDKLDIEFSLDGIQSQVAPLALQMLIENAIKHNVVSEDDPLHIRLYADSEFIVVENNLQKKTSLGEPSAGVGLENICKRYEFLSKTKVAIIQDDQRFMVKLPLLTSMRGA